MDWGFDYIADNGITTEAAYPYMAIDQKCTREQNKPETGAATLTSYTDVVQDKDSFLQALSERVVSVGVDAQLWVYYSKGIYNMCGTSLDHGVAAVGYNVAEGWIKIRNSWGLLWGEAGHIRIKLDDSFEGTCGVYSSASFPVV